MGNGGQTIVVVVARKESGCSAATAQSGDHEHQVNQEPHIRPCDQTPSYGTSDDVRTNVQDDIAEREVPFFRIVDVAALLKTTDDARDHDSSDAIDGEPKVIPD